jgi:hypothetical protein
MDESGRSRVVSILKELAGEWEAGPPPDWENDTVPAYLEAMAAWLDDSDGYYGRFPPKDPWVYFGDALRAGALYE